MQENNGKYLWFAILGLGFNPEEEISALVFAAKMRTKHINLGPSMFDKPNKDAFYIVTRFLLERLNPTRFNELYRHCWPITNHKMDADFRKVTCSWLREIMDETTNAGSKVQASLFLSPGGPKFVTLMLNLATHVLLQEMKTFKTDGTWFPEAAASPASSANMAMKRLDLIRTRFLKTAVDQNCFIQDYQRRAQSMVKSMREYRADGAKYDELLKKHSNDTVQDQASLLEKASKVRALWSTTEEVLSSTKEEQHAVRCVLKGDVDQYILDGTEKALKVPPCLLERIQQLPHQLSSGNVYEGGQLNLLSVLELTNHALKLLKEEQTRISHCPQTLLVPEQIQEKCQQMSRVLQDLNHIRQKISKEEAPEVKTAIKELELEWDTKWNDVLQNTPLTTFLNEDPALDFLSPMAPLSFEPAPEASYKKSIFSQYPAKLLDTRLEKLTQHEMVNKFNMSNTFLTRSAEDSPVVSAEASSLANTSLDWLFDGPFSLTKTKPASSVQLGGKPDAHSKLPGVTPLRSKTEIIAKECDNLADQFADAVITSSATTGQAQSLKLEDLLLTLHGDPFSTRKQLPRTPESLIMDVKSSWRKALAEDKAERLFSSNDSVKEGLTPLGDAPFGFQSPCFTASSKPTLSPLATEDTPSVCQQRTLMKSNLGWDTFNTELIDSPSGTGSSAVQFSLDHETLPEMPSCDSLLSLEDDDDDDEEVSPSLLKDLKPTINEQLECTDSLFDGQIHAPEHLLSPDILTLDSNWMMDPINSEKNNDKKFSLDFDALNTPSTSSQDYSLPKLLTFSPIDDMKC